MPFALLSPFLNVRLITSIVNKTPNHPSHYIKLATVFKDHPDIQIFSSITLLSSVSISCKIVRNDIFIGDIVSMKKIIIACFAALLLVFGGLSSAQADEYLRVGMEAAYAPFNWTQDDNSNGAVPIEGTKQYANGYDVQIAKKVAEAQGKKPLVVKTAWTGLIPALTSGKIDMIIAGMSPTAERRQEIDFSDRYYRSEPVMVVSSDGDYAKAKSVKDFKDAKITGQQGVYLYNLIDQIPNVNKQTAMGDFGAMRQALASGIIDGYVSERPEARTAEKASSKYKMISLKDGGFQVSDDDVSLAVGLRKGDSQQMEQVNKVLAGISQEKRVKLMDHIIDIQPADKTDEAKKGKLL